MTTPDWRNRLYFGDNLDILRNHVPDASVDLIYLDPPFNSNANYNVLFQEKTGQQSAAQITAFEDTWHWSLESESAYQDVVTNAPKKLSDLLQAMRSFLGENDMMAYLTMMAQRMVELHRVLKDTGSIYLHCDPTASHYLKLMMDAVFGWANFQSEITWKRTSAHSDSRRFGQVKDTILFYSKSNVRIWNSITVPHDESYVSNFYRHEDNRGRYRLHEIIRTASMGPRPNLAYEYNGYTPEWGWRMERQKLEALDKEGRLVWSDSGRPYRKTYLSEGQAPSNLWDDVGNVSAQSKERLNRRWIGIDITHIAITLIRHRLQDTFKDELKPYEVLGQPQDTASAQALAADSENSGRYQFEWWALGLVDARPAQDRKKGADSGIDGYINFFDDNTGKAKRIVVQVKSGHVTRNQVATLNSDRQREKAEIGLFITLQPPTRPMEAEAASAGLYTPEHFPDSHYPRIQILTIEDLLNGAKRAEYPRLAPEATFRRAARRRRSPGTQSTFA